jgi:hypothetical protein
MKLWLLSVYQKFFRLEESEELLMYRLEKEFFKNFHTFEIESMRDLYVSKYQEINNSHAITLKNNKCTCTFEFATRRTAYIKTIGIIRSASLKFVFDNATIDLPLTIIKAENVINLIIEHLIEHRFILGEFDPELHKKGIFQQDLISSDVLALAVNVDAQERKASHLIGYKNKGQKDFLLKKNIKEYSINKKQVYLSFFLKDYNSQLKPVQKLSIL